MFERLKNAISTLSFAWKYGDLVRSVLTAWSSFPGWDSELLRVWIRPLLLDVSVLTTLTKTKIDDMIVLAAVRIVDNNRAWDAMFALAMLVRDGVGLEGNLIPQDSADSNLSVDAIAREACPDCPATGLAAIGLILYLLQNRSR
ncbi:MAG TPA: hypothetical protein DEB39_12140 [Planctomycetaceae bacterium]|nr:hypothetical protein [Planctomycetaceae bacterium]